MSRYPRFGKVVKKYRISPAGVTCSVCLKPRVYRIEIQFGWFRGSDDEVYFCCEEHYGMARRETSEFVAMAGVKEKADKQLAALKPAPREVVVAEAEVTVVVPPPPVKSVRIEGEVAP